MKQFSWQKIAEFRRAMGLGQKELADRVGVMTQQISAWERSDPEKSLTVGNLKKIADALQKKTDDFFTEDNLEDHPTQGPQTMAKPAHRKGATGHPESEPAGRGIPA